MEELLIAIVSGLVENQSSIKVDVDQPDADGVIVYHLHVAQEDM